MEDRTLSDADIAEIVDQLEARALERLQTNIGKGIISLIWTWLARAVVLYVAYKLGAGGVLSKIGF